jgi:uncharacterized protein YoxC
MNAETPSPQDLQIILAKIRLLNQVDSRLDDITNKAEELEAILGKLTAKVEDLSDKIQSCSSDLSDCEAAMDSLSEAAAGVTESVTEAVRPATGNSSDEEQHG